MCASPLTLPPPPNADLSEAEHSGVTRSALISPEHIVCLFCTKNMFKAGVRRTFNAG